MMKKFKDERVQKFLNEVAELDREKFLILKKLREIVFEVYPGVEERMMYGGIMFSLEGDFGGVFVNKKHISFEFSNGVEFDDPKKHLEGTGKFRRHLKLRAMSDINDKQAAFFIKQSA